MVAGEEEELAYSGNDPKEIMDTVLQNLGLTGEVGERRPSLSRSDE